jgi:hypothetical protein
MGWFNRKIALTLIDDATGEAFATSEMPPENLPESFEIETTMHIGDADWSVVHAEPRTRMEYKKLGSLTLRLCKIEKISTDDILYSQVDITDQFDDNLRLSKDEWITTMPLNARGPNLEAFGLPSPDADSDTIYLIASKMSSLRESIPIPGDGVYCPICHIANIDLEKLRTPCPKCGRELLKFGWT